MSALALAMLMSSSSTIVTRTREWAGVEYRTADRDSDWFSSDSAKARARNTQDKDPSRTYAFDYFGRAIGSLKSFTWTERVEPHQLVELSLSSFRNRHGYAQGFVRNVTRAPNAQLIERQFLPLLPPPRRQQQHERRPLPRKKKHVKH